MYTERESATATATNDYWWYRSFVVQLSNTHFVISLFTNKRGISLGCWVKDTGTISSLINSGSSNDFVQSSNMLYTL